MPSWGTWVRRRPWRKQLVGLWAGPSLEIKQLDVCDEIAIQACAGSLPGRRVDMLSAALCHTLYEIIIFLFIFVPWDVVRSEPHHTWASVHLVLHVIPQLCLSEYYLHLPYLCFAYNEMSMNDCLTLTPYSWLDPLSVNLWKEGCHGQQFLWSGAA